MRPKIRLVLRWIARGLLALVIAGVIAGLVLWWHFTRSVASLDGMIVMTPLSEAVSIQRDQNGVPTILASDRLDTARALGFLHAQDRLLGMDLNRRLGAGELAALVGEKAVEYDKWYRLFPGRDLAKDAYASLPADDRQLVDAYTEGVNAGINALKATPPEYLLPGAHVVSWKPEDCLLVAFSMYYNLQDCRAQIDEKRAIIRDALPKEVVAYLFGRTPMADAPLDGSAGPVLTLPLDAWTNAVKKTELLEQETVTTDTESMSSGSNAWAAGSGATSDGRAILANDMKLALQIPHVWYRASGRYTAPDGSPVAIDGPTLPGLPVWIVGSNRHIAWGFTNSYTDQTDLVILELHPDDPTKYRTREGWKPFTIRTESIEVASAKSVPIEVRETIWGPVREGVDGNLYAVIWMGAQRGFWNMGLEHMARARSIDEAIAIAQYAAVPAQNFVVADDCGEVAWSLIGPLPDRNGINGFYPLTVDAIGEGWQGFLPPEKRPVIRHPADDRVWTANQRMIGGDRLALVGDGGYDAGYRATRIRDRLAAPHQTEESMHSIQGEITAIHLEPWRRYFLDTLDPEALNEVPERTALRERIEAWNGQADADSVIYTQLTAVRSTIIALMGAQRAKPLGANANAIPTNHGIGFDEIALECLSASHDQFAPRKFVTMRQFTLHLLDALARVSSLKKPWGERNALAMHHPILGGIPVLGRLFKMPSTPQPGDAETVRVLRPGFGSSQRMVVSPGHEEDGFYHQPGGASGHFLSPFFRAGHQDWVEMNPSPFLPGPAVHTLILSPK